MAAELWSAPAPGALADLAPELGGAVAGQLALRVAPALLRELRDADAANRRNAVGVWARAAPGALGPQLPALLQARAVSSLRRL